MDCADPTCSDHGFCVDGACICKKGWKGLDCGTLDEEARQCLPDCSGNGVFDLEAQQCNCNEGWVGEDCSSRLCSLDCGPHGRFVNARNGRDNCQNSIIMSRVVPLGGAFMQFLHSSRATEIAKRAIIILRFTR